MKSRIKVTSALISYLIAFAVQTTMAAEVRKISPEVLGNENVWSVSVSCAEIDQPRVIERQGESGKWCAKELPTACSSRKLSVAKKVCGTHFERNIAKYQQTLNKVDTVAIQEQKEPEIEVSVPDVEKVLEPVVETIAEIQTDTVATRIEPEEDAYFDLNKEILEIEEQKLLLREKRLELERKKLELESSAEN